MSLQHQSNSSMTKSFASSTGSTSSTLFPGCRRSSSRRWSPLRGADPGKRPISTASWGMDPEKNLDRWGRKTEAISRCERPRVWNRRERYDCLKGGKKFVTILEETILVQGLRRDIEINFHISNIYGSVAQWIKCSAGELKNPDSIPSEGDFISLKFHLKRKWTKWWTTTQVIPWSLADSRRQKAITTVLS